MNPELALKLLRMFKKRFGHRHSWREVQREIIKRGHSDAFLVHAQKLANWDNPKRRTPLEPRALAVILDFFDSDVFRQYVPEAIAQESAYTQSVDSGREICKLAGIYELGEIEEKIFQAMEGFWWNPYQHQIFLYVRRVEGYNFCIAHACELIPGRYFDDKDQYSGRFYEKFFASGFLYFTNDTHSKKAENGRIHPAESGQIADEHDSENGRIYRRIQCCKSFNLKLWTRVDRMEATLEGLIEIIPKQTWELTYDNSVVVNSYMDLFLKRKDDETPLDFMRANYIQKTKVKDYGVVGEFVREVKKDLYNIRWSVHS